MKNEYYKAYEKRYQQVYEKELLWEIPINTPKVINTLLKYNIEKKDDDILELGCGEGRDAIYLLNEGYNVLAVDYSKTVINKCNLITENKYASNFMQFDLIEDNMNKKFDFIYSVAVIHMFVKQSHRNAFYNFIKEHLKENGVALIIAMGDGKEEFNTDINDAFTDTLRENVNSKEKILVAQTSCRVKNILNMREEIINSGLNIVEEMILSDVPGFDKCLSFVVKR